MESLCLFSISRKFSFLQYGLRLPLSTADIFTVAVVSGVTRAVDLDIQKSFNRVWDPDLSRKHTYLELWHRFSAFFLNILLRQLCVVLVRKSS